MSPRPDFEPRFAGAQRLAGKVALITGGDSGIGRAAALAMAREGASIAIVYLDEHKDAAETRRLVEIEGVDAITLPADVTFEGACRDVVRETVGQLGRLDILVNNAAEQHVQNSIESIDEMQLERTFRTNVFGYFHMIKRRCRTWGRARRSSTRPRSPPTRAARS